MSETQKTESELGNLILAEGWEKKRSSLELRSYLGRLATRRGLDEYDVEIEEAAA
ncbi:hypothetical protein H7Y40_00550 [Pedobacter sp.]|nr:hypothetical protein [Candidatus Saccharibacteria bacterium]